MRSNGGFRREEPSSSVSTLTGNNGQTLCASVPAETPFCLASNSGVSDPFHKTLTVTIGSKTKTDTFTTGKRQTGNSPPAAPTVAVYGDLQDERSSSAVLSWSPVPGAYTDLPQTSYGYDVVYSLGHTWYRAATCSLPHVAGDTGKVVCDYEACTYRLNALDPHQSYRFSVRVHGEGGTSGWADNVSLALGAPVTDLQATRTNATTIRVTWTDPTSDSDTSYHVTYHDGSVNRMADANEIIEVGGNGRRLDLTVDPHRAYRIGVRVATPDGDYAGRWSPWRDVAAVPPASLPQVSGLKRFWNGAYQGRLGVRWNKLPGATGYHLTVARRKGGKHGPKSNHLVAMHHTGDWLMVTDWAKIQLCKGDWVRVGVRPLYEPDGKWVNDGSNTDQPDVAGPWRDTPESPYWTVMNKHDPVNNAQCPHQ